MTGPMTGPTTGPMTGPMTGPIFTLAVAQTRLSPGDIETNLAAMSARAGQAAMAGADLIVFPELAPSCYGVGAALRDLAEPVDGPGSARLARAAREHGIAVCYGYAERDGAALYNSAALIGADGALLANHRKSHLFGDYERGLFRHGTTPLTIASVAGLKIALLICYEVEFPEMARAAALAGAELIAVPTATASYGSASRFSEMVIAARATENNVFVAYANHCGSDGHYDYMGKSIIAGPLTDIYALAGAEPELLIARLDRARLAEGEARVPYRHDRRPALYGGA